MQLRIIFSAIFIFYSTSVFLQELVPPVLQFNSVQENWVYISKDDNYNEYFKSLSNQGLTPYSLKQNLDIVQDGDEIYILERTHSPSPFLGLDGFLLHKLDKFTGAKSWVYHNNFMSGNKHREMYNSKIHKDAEGNIKINGYRDIDTINYQWPRFGFYGNPVTRTINAQGELLNERYGTSQLRIAENEANVLRKILTVNDKDLYCYFSFGNESENYIENFRCYPVDESYNIDKDSFYNIVYPSELGINNVFSSYYQKSFLEIHPDTILTLTLFGTTNTETSPENAKLNWVVVDNSGMAIHKSVDITKDIFRPQDISVFHQIINTQILDDYIVLHQTVPPTPSITDARWLTWMVVYDRNGKLVAKPDYIFNKAKQYSAVTILKIVDKKMYLSVRMDDGVTMGADILEVDLTTGKNKQVGSLHVKTSNNYKIGFIENFKYLDDGNIIVALPMDIIHNNEMTSIRYYFSFKLDDLGMLTSTDENTHFHQDFKIVPNPISDEINVLLPVVKEQMYVQITDQTGRILVVKDVSNAATSIDMSWVRAGLYFVSLYDATTGKAVGQAKKVVKIDSVR